MSSVQQDDLTVARWVIPFCNLIGVIGLVFGSLGLLYAYAFASMVNPALSDAAWRQQVFERMLLNGDIGGLTYFCLAIILLSLTCICGPWIVMWRRQKAAKIPRPHRSLRAMDADIRKKWAANQVPPESIRRVGDISEGSE
jgi:hypothetical protein